MKRKVKRLAKMLFSLLLCCALTLTSIQMPAYAKSGEWTGGQVDSGYRLKIVYSESAQNPKTNTSKVTATLYLVQDKGYDLYIGARSATITINGNQTTISNIPAIRNTGNVTTKLGSATTTVKHTSDGSKSITISASFDMNAKLSGTYYGTMSTSKKVSLDKLDRTAPTVSLKLNSVTSSSVKMTATADVSCDNWQYSLDGGSTWKTFASSGKSNAFTISNLSGGKKYTVVARVRKTDNNVFSEQSKSVSATTKPNPPGNLSVSAVKKDSAKLSWNNTTGATSYNVYLNDKVIEKNVQGTSYTFSGLIPNSAYTFGVSATGTSGDSTLAKTAEYVTLASAPTKVKVQSQNQDSVKLSWSQSTDGNEATITYNIYRDDILIGTSSTNSYADTVYNNTDCKYAVCAVTSAGNSAKSSAVSVKHVPLSINAEATNKSYYTIITPTYKGGVNREIDPTSCKWAYGNKEISDFENGGYVFSTSFAVTKNGTYTVYAQDVDGNEAVGTITVSDIYTIDTIGAFTENDTDFLCGIHWTSGIF
ncbi:MAG: fibronectin type III domain-containing protein [Lachnospiraceae bacterium]|nr:fibronectin type III domain-containing protein [Lachnospiraceae bacterium]